MRSSCRSSCNPGTVGEVRPAQCTYGADAVGEQPLTRAALKGAEHRESEIGDGRRAVPRAFGTPSVCDHKETPFISVVVGIAARKVAYPRPID